MNKIEKLIDIEHRQWDEMDLSSLFYVHRSVNREAIVMIMDSPNSINLFLLFSTSSTSLGI